MKIYFSRIRLVVLFICVSASQLLADEFHYKNILIGERAAGLGGAFVAISDDPSGIYHNPAGIVFGLENYLSLSANAFSSSSQTIKDVYPGQDYTLKSSNLVPAFFGFTQTYGQNKIGFAIIVPNSDLIDQTDTITRQNDGTVDQRRFVRKYFQQDNTYLAGPAIAREISKNLSLGVSVLLMYRTTKFIDNTTIMLEPVESAGYGFFIRNANTARYGVMIRAGMQFMPIPKLSIGLMVARPISLGGSGEIHKIDSVTSSGLPTTQTGVFNTDFDKTDVSVSTTILDTFQFSLGSAYFFSREFLLTGQIDFYTGKNSYSDYSIRPVFNWSFGGEYYLSESLAVRMGGYSNNANSNALASTGTNQNNHVNRIGGVAGLSYFRPGSSLTLSTSYEIGSGQGQAISGVTTIQEISESSLGVYLSGSYQL